MKTNLITVGIVSGIPIRVHWTLLAACAALMLASLPFVLSPLAAITAYLLSVLVHEGGHAYVARRRHCKVHQIELYALVGLVRFSQPYYRSDHCIIAWAGIAAQAAVAIPVGVCLMLLGYTGVPALDVFLGTFTWLSIGMILFNLLPVPGLDGALAWSLLPSGVFPRVRWFRRRKTKRGWNALNER